MTFMGKKDMPCVASELEKQHDLNTYLSPEEETRIEEEKSNMKVELAVNWLSAKQGRTWEAIGPDGVNEQNISADDVENYILEKIKSLQHITDDMDKLLLYTDIGKLLVEQAINYGSDTNETIVWKLPK